ncbi:MAG: sensor histidine kinase [Thermoanaerobaculia bacterium]
MRHGAATLLRMNLICVVPITLVLFSVAPVQTWERFWRIIVLVAVVSNANFALLTAFHRLVWSKLRFHSRVIPYVALALIVLPLIALVCAAASRVILAAFSWVAVPTLVELLQINLPLVFVYGLSFFYARDSRSHLAGVSSDLDGSRRDNVELVLERDEMKLFALQVLLNPHFLFNSLNTIAALIHDQPAKAEEATILLSRVLRRIVERRDTSLVPLRTELEIVTDYLGIERIRLGDRFTFAIDVAEEMLDILVPAMIVQPLVENAIHHGIRQRPDAGHIRIRAWTKGDECHIEITDNGPGVSSHHGTGQARRLLHNRLEALYGRGHFAMDLLRDDGRGETIAALSLPLRTRALES